MLIMTLYCDPAEASRIEAIYHKYIRLMIYTAQKILKNPSDAEDAVQQAFVAIINNIEKIRDVDSAKTKAYIMLTVECKAIDIIRHRTNDTSLESVPDTAGYEFSVSSESGLELLISKLPATYREIIILKYFNGYTTKEISKILNLSYDNTRKILWRAKQMLKTALNSNEYGG